MSLINIKPYEISVWTEKQIYYFSVTENGQTTYVESPIWLSTNAERTVNLLNEYMQETKVGVIGANDMDAPIRALNPIFKSNINGSHTLTFDIYMRYTDDEGEEHDNPWIGYLCNERKVKLSYDGEWYDFVIKEVREDSKKKTISYSCTDVFIEDLSKIGFNIEMKTDLENNMGTVQQLGETILLETSWTCVPNEGHVYDSQGHELKSDVIRQYNNEALFVYVTDQAIRATKLLSTDPAITIPALRTIYICYSSVVNREANPEFFYREDGQYVVDDSGVILNGGPYRSSDLGILIHDREASSFAVSTQYRGNKLVAAQKSRYIASLDKYCQEWTKNHETYYGYQQTTYAVGENLQQILNNNHNYISTDGWFASEAGEGEGIPTIHNLYNYTRVQEQDIITSTQLQLDYPANSVPVWNSGPYDNRAIFQEGLIKDDSLIIGIKYTSDDYFNIPDDPTIEDSHDTIQSVLSYLDNNTPPGQDPPKITLTWDFVPFNQNDPKPKQGYDGYLWYKCIFERSFSYDELMDISSWNIEFNSCTDKTIECSDILLFRKMTNKEGTKTYLVVPDLHNIQPVTSRYFLAKETELSRLGSQIQFTAMFTSKEEAIEPGGFSPVIDDSEYEKIRSIEAEKSNCFNLIQSLCETFECWVVFHIVHDDLGYTEFQYYLTDDSSRQAGKIYYKVRDGVVTPDITDHKDFRLLGKNEAWDSATTYERKWDKYIIFREYISKDNYAGFRPGINLVGTQRNIISNDLVTKLIVTPNANTHATDGFCTIQLAQLNETGESCIFNFDYFVQQKLVDKSGLYRDLYNRSDTNGMGYLIKLKELNQQVEPYVSEQVQLNTVLMRSKALYQSYSISAQEAHEQYLLYQGYLTDNGYGDAKYDSQNPHQYPEIVQDWVRQRDLYASRKTYYKGKSAEYHEAVNTYETRLQTVKDALSAIEEQKRWLNHTFNTKYSRFIREGNWMDQDYIDPELYYLDAMGVSYNSAFPRVSYTFSVIAVDGIEEYAGYTFRVGDKTYVEDTDFFGWKDDGVTPFHQEVIVSAISYTLDNPSKNSITVQNFKDQFDSLFQRITASTQSLQYSEGGYARAAAAIRPNQTISEELMNRALNENSAIISNAADQSVNWGTDGITISSIIDPGRIVRLVNGGIALTEDGGKNWTTGITAKGINAKTITTGTLDTSLVRVYSGSQPAFVWNEDGLFAYARDGSGHVNEQKYVKFYQDGIMGFDGEKETFHLTYDGLGLTRNNTEMTPYTYDWLIVNDPTLSQHDYYEIRHEKYVHTTDAAPQPGKTYYVPIAGTVFFNISVNESNTYPVCDVANNYTTTLLHRILWFGRDWDDGFSQYYNAITDQIVTTTNSNFVLFEDGTMYAKNGIFEGTLYANQLAGALTALDDENTWLIGAGLCIGSTDDAASILTDYGRFKLVIEPDGDILSYGEIDLRGKSTIRSGDIVSYITSGYGSGVNGRLHIKNGEILFATGGQSGYPYTEEETDSWSTAESSITFGGTGGLQLRARDGYIILGSASMGLVLVNHEGRENIYGATLPPESSLIASDEGRIFFLVEE